MENYDLRIVFMDGKVATVLKIQEHLVKDGTLICKYDGRAVGTYPICNIRQWTEE